MIIRKYIIIAVMLIGAISLASMTGKAEGEYGWKMLTIPAGAYIPAMGGTGSSVSTEADAFLSNPTANLFGNNKGVSLSQNIWLFGTKINSAALSVHKGGVAYGFVLRALDYGEFEARDISGDIIGEFHPLDVNLAGNIAFRLNPDIYAGVNLIVLYQKIDTASSLGAAVDLGTTYITPLNGLKVQAALKHIGITTKVIEERIKFPVAPELGLGYKLPLSFRGDSRGFLSLQEIYTEMKVVSHPDDKIKAAIGSNIIVSSALELRLGYMMNYDSWNFSAGMGLSLKRMVFNYAYLPFKYDGNDIHSFGLTYRF